eukprot:1722744-Amphidinium_carterae.1
MQEMHPNYKKWSAQTQNIRLAMPMEQSTFFDPASTMAEETEQIKQTCCSRSWSARSDIPEPARNILDTRLNVRLREHCAHAMQL